ncbi:GDP dissociation inhibitor-domain-containing protein [Catenaria anguillulae PL171]|uniref:GDP dissociation inhibitor-domain-containing protein n=1 Tax=Catenaria anguillulae PL171 TaxID=765915 RepID=A0A1Y2HZA9_9FUNG|nr:GDP dissociation inhibitor-domain-containing protein [Catenaria anguillulae PL171]
MTMDSQCNSTHFDVLVLGTGLNESLIAAAHSRRGDTVLHLDPTDCYGGAWAGMDLKRFQSLTGQLEGFAEFEHSLGPAASSMASIGEQQSNRFAIELAPKLLYARGALVDLFSQTGAGRHLDFKLVEGTFISSPPPAAATAESTLQSTPDLVGPTDRVPASKEDVFASKSISLIDKRRLMKFFTNEMAAVQGLEEVPEDASFADYLHSHDIKGQLETVLTYGVALLTKSNESAQTGTHLVRKYLDSLGRFGNSPFLACMYGGGGEIAQSLCRVAAVYGGVYILGRHIAPVAFDRERKVWKVTVDHELTFTADKLVANAYTLKSLVPSVDVQDAPSAQRTHNAVVLATQGVRDDTQLGLYIVPPAALGNVEHAAERECPAHAVQVVDMGSEMQVCPKDVHVLHFRGSSRSNVDMAIRRLLPAECIIQTTHFTHASVDPTAQLSQDLQDTVFVVPSVTMALDVDSDVAPVIQAWKGEVGQEEFMAPLPNPDEEQMVNEARQLQEQDQEQEKDEAGQTQGAAKEPGAVEADKP